MRDHDFAIVEWNIEPSNILHNYLARGSVIYPVVFYSLNGLDVDSMTRWSSRGR